MYGKYIKRLFDIIFCLIAMPFFVLIFVFVAPFIFAEDGGSVFYAAERLGRNGRPFKMYKFRSMKVGSPDLRNEDGSTYNSESDCRVTKIGRILRKTSLDETPQLFNVLFGEMSIVGPRPGTTDAVMTENEMKRRSVRPGITGYSQAYYRNSDTMEERMKNDIYYSENIGFITDLRIVIKTMGLLLNRRNIYRN